MRPMPSVVRQRLTRQNRSRGQSLVEFAIVVPVAIFIMAFAIDFGRAFMGWINLTNATRIAANYAAQHPYADWSNASDPDRLRYVAMVTRDLTTSNCPPTTVALPTFSPDTNLGSSATVALACSFHFVTPLIGNVLGNPLPMTASTSYPIRTGEYGNPIPNPTPTPTDGDDDPTPNPTPTPPQCTAPNFIDQRVNDAQNIWQQAGFQTTVVKLPGSGNYKIGQQDKTGGQPYACAGTTVTVGP